MRDYAKLAPTFWTGTTGKALRKKGHEAVIVALYLVSSPHSNMLGLFYQPLMYMAHETGLGIEGASKGLQWCIESEFCSFDEASEMVWVHEMAAWQIADALSSADKRCKGIQKDYDALPDNPFLAGWFDRYGKAFHMSAARGHQTRKASPIEAPSKPHRSQEQEQEQEQEQKPPPTPHGGRVHSFPAGFDRFWEAYPRKVGKDAAAKAFAKRKPDEALIGRMLQALAVQKASEAWSKDRGQYVPNPATWLNQGRWMDEVHKPAGDAWAGAL